MYTGTHPIELIFQSIQTKKKESAFTVYKGTPYCNSENQSPQITSKEYQQKKAAKYSINVLLLLETHQNYHRPS